MSFVFDWRPTSPGSCGCQGSLREEHLVWRPIAEQVEIFPVIPTDAVSLAELVDPARGQAYLDRVGSVSALTDAPMPELTTQLNNELEELPF